jgi:tRNA (guanine-N7-)-methyltransferase
MQPSPISPAHMDWGSHFPAFIDPDFTKITVTGAQKLVKDVEVVDIGCGYGGLLVGLAPLMPDVLMVGKYTLASVTLTALKNKGRWKKEKRD